VHSVLSHRRPTARSRKLTITIALLCGLLVAGAIGAPIAFAQGSSWVAAGPARTIYAGQAAGIYVRAGGAAKPGMYIALHQQTARGWNAVAVSRLTGNNGGAFYPKPGATTVYRVAVVANKDAAASFSQPVRISVLNRGVAVVAEASKHKGKPYRYGAAGPYAFDCSGFTQFVYRKFGRSLPHSATQQGRLGVSIAKGAARPGDLLVFGSPGRYYHAAIFAGNGYMVDSSTSGQPVALRRIWSNNFAVRRLV
jgi:cell wall-associated NlpC family hydrolase